MAMENKRITQLSTERLNLTSGDYVMVDDADNGSAKYRLDRLKETDTTLSVSGKAADAAATGQAISDEAEARDNADNALGEDISDLKSAIDYYDDPVTWVDGYFLVWNTGAEFPTSNGYSYFKYLLDETALAVHVETTMSSIAGICFYDSDGNYIPNSGIRNATENNFYISDLLIPAGAKEIGVSCVTQNKGTATIKTTIRQQVNAIIEALDNKAALPSFYTTVDATIQQGLMNKDGTTIFNPSDDYGGRYATAHFNAGDVLKLSGNVPGSNYPLLVIVYDDNTKAYDFGASGIYTDQFYTMQKSGTVYINGLDTVSPIIKKLYKMSQDEFNSTLNDFDAILKTVFVNGKLKVKKRISNSKSICVEFGNVGGNSLFNFSRIYQIDEPYTDRLSDDFTSNGTDIGAGSTDWFGPYVVQAVNNADGDVPEGNSYFTGGNHRSNNTGSGGGITAKQNYLSILINGVTPIVGEVYATTEVIVKWSNDVQGNNTSKSTGDGRAILTENWSMKINADGIFCENDFVAKEAITLKTYYGLQAYFPGSNVLMKGGTTRTPIAMGNAGNSGNKTCRNAVAYNTSFSVEMDIFAVDLGLFENTTQSFVMTNANKLYCYAVSQDVSIAQGEHYFIGGCYKIN